jgi:hypothetical protein
MLARRSPIPNQEGDAMTILSRTVLALAVVLFGVSQTASANPIPPASSVAIGTFNYVVEQCDTDLDPFCENFEHFSLTNDLVASDPLYGGLTFFAAVDLGGTTVDLIDGFGGSGPLGVGQSAITGSALEGFYFSLASVATLTFTGGNFADYGTLFISGPLSPGNSLATVYLDPVSTPEPASIALFASGLAMAALRRRRGRSQKSSTPCLISDKVQRTPR